MPNRKVRGKHEWEVLERLGKGGQGVAYRARCLDGFEGKDCVVKFMRRHAQPAEHRPPETAEKRFQLEVQSLRLLTDAGCPRIVDVLDSELAPEAGGEPWFAMPRYVAGAMFDDGRTPRYLEPFEGNVGRVLEIAADLTSQAQGVFEELRGSRGPIPLRGEDPVFAGLLAPKRRPHTREGHVPGSDRDRLEARLTTRFRRLTKSLGMTGVSVHTLRHSCASRMVAAGVPLSFVARVTGHSTLSCAARYGKHAPTDAGRIAIRALEAATAAPGASLVAPLPQPPSGAPSAVGAAP